MRHHHDTLDFLDHTLLCCAVLIAHDLNFEITYGNEFPQKVLAQDIGEPCLFYVFRVRPDVVSTHKQIVGRKGSQPPVRVGPELFLLVLGC